MIWRHSKESSNLHLDRPLDRKRPEALKTYFMRLIYHLLR